ncbi:MAG: hypothetical protein ABIU06_19605 [Anaerolineales bacterium]
MGKPEMKSAHIPRSIDILLSLVLAGCELQGNATSSPITTIRTSPPNTPSHVTETPSATDQPAPSPTLKSIPILSPEDALENFASLIEKDGECILPCWLGVVPGQTNFYDVADIFSQFSAIASTKFSSASAYIRVFFPNFETAIHATTTEVYSASEVDCLICGDGKVSRVWVNAGVDPKGTQGNITYSNPEYQKIWQRYFVPGIFTTHGTPEKIFLDTTLIMGDPSTSFPFALWIVYPQQGFLIRYNGDNIKTGENIRICPMQSRIEITIWDTKTSSYEEFMKNAEGGGISLGPQPIESVTDFDIESFYETFKAGQLDTCFETPASIWPPN